MVSDDEETDDESVEFMPHAKKFKLPSHSSFVDSSDDDCDIKENVHSSQPESMDVNCSSTVSEVTSEASSSLCPVVVLLKKTEEDELPDPFPLPKNYPTDVEIALRSKKMTKETMKAFMSSVASAMLTYKRYPNKQEYTRVAKDILLKFPFMKPLNGSPTVSLLNYYVVIILYGILGRNCADID